MHLLKRGITPKIIKVKLNFFRKSAFCCSVLILGRHGARYPRALPKNNVLLSILLKICSLNRNKWLI